MKSVLIWVGAFFIYACNSESKHITSVNNSPETEGITRDSIPPTKIDGSKEYSFKIILDTSEFILKTIIIYHKNKAIQRITTNKEISELNFNLIDWNFDGFKDISIRSNCGSGGCAYWIWNYSPKNNQFIYNKDLSDVIGLEIDSIGEFIVIHYRTGYSEERWDSLKYENQELKFVKGLYTVRWNDSSGNLWVKNTYSKLIKNSIITRADSFVTR